MQIWNGCNVLNIAGHPIKVINVNLSFMSSRLNVVEWIPQFKKKNLNSFLSLESKVVELTPNKNWHVGLHYSAFWVWLLWHVISFLQVWRVCTHINFDSNLGYFLAVKQVGKVYIYVWYVSKALHLPNVEILILYLWSIDDCKLAINLFPISWEPFENINLLYFLLKMQIWNGFNVFNIPGNLIKDINVNLSILSVGWKVVECIPLALAHF